MFNNLFIDYYILFSIFLIFSHYIYNIYILFKKWVLEQEEVDQAVTEVVVIDQEEFHIHIHIHIIMEVITDITIMVIKMMIAVLY